MENEEKRDKNPYTDPCEAPQTPHTDKVVNINIVLPDDPLPQVPPHIEKVVNINITLPDELLPQTQPKREKEPEPQPEPEPEPEPTPEPEPEPTIPEGIEIPSKKRSLLGWLFAPAKHLPAYQRFDAYLKANIDHDRSQKGLPIKPPIGTKDYLQKYYQYRKELQAKAGKKP